MELHKDGPFTTGQIAKMLRCAPRTVAKWFDSGKLKGYKLNDDRRIPLEALIEFLESAGIPLPKELK